MEFSLERFEHLAYSRQQEPAALELQQLLAMLDANFGKIGPGFSCEPLGAVPPAEMDIHISTRIAGAISALFSDPTFFLTPSGFAQFITWQRWLSVIFATSAFRNADHIIRALNIHGGNLRSVTLNDERSLTKFCLLYTPESEIPLDMDILWSYDRTLTIALCFALLSSRLLASPISHNKREILLDWLPSRLGEISDISQVPTQILHDVYMHCTYADLPQKHDIKRALNRLIRQNLLDNGFADLPPMLLPVPGQKPVMLILLEWYGTEHSVYRVLSKAIQALGRHFRLVGVGHESLVDVRVQGEFNEFVLITTADLRQQIQLIRETTLRVGARILFMPSLGMSLLNIYVSNMRLAPIQAFAFGHPATSHAATMDYFVIEEDFLGDPECFSEQLLILPPKSLPFVPSSRLPANLNAVIRQRPSPVKIVVPGSLMKLNPEFLAACRAISDQAATPVEFHFLVGLTEGLVWAQTEQNIRSFLGHVATVYPHLVYDQYMAVIGQCDLFISPFPFGNGNGVVDVLTFGMAGVCRSGREVCEHVDDGLFRRVGLPSWLIAATTEEFVAATVRLVDDHEERVRIREKLVADNAVTRLFSGNADILGERLIKLVTSRYGH